jgi:hypothetical protein
MLVQFFIKNVGSTFCLKKVASSFIEKCCNICWKNVDPTFPKKCRQTNVGNNPKIC